MTIWYPFNERTIRRLIHGQPVDLMLFVVLRMDKKTYCGQLGSESDIKPDGITLHNWNVSQNVKFDLGPPKRFTVVSLDAMLVKVLDPTLPIK